MAKDTYHTAEAGGELKRERRVLRGLRKFERRKNARLQRLTVKAMKAHLKYCDDMDRIMLQLDHKAYGKLLRKNQCKHTGPPGNMGSPAKPSSEAGPLQMDDCVEATASNEETSLTLSSPTSGNSASAQVFVPGSASGTP